jgi:peptide/nickel transport system permease protein
MCAAAPLYAHYVAHVNPFQPNLNGHTVVHGKVVPVMEQGGGALKLGETPIGPTWDPHHYFLGADGLGRDVAALLLYGGRSSLLVGIGSAVICCVVATVVALIAGFFGGITDSILSRVMDIIWAFPVYLLAISLATELLTHSNGFQVGPLHVSASSLWVPTLLIAFIFLPYVYRPIRGQVLSVINREFVEAAIAEGAGNLRLIFSEILPNVVSTVIVLLPLMIATTILTESALSFLGLGVQPPNVSWGSIISDGQDLLYTRPWVSMAPGIMIVLTVLAMNVLGDGVRDALDPRAKLRVEG